MKPIKVINSEVGNQFISELRVALRGIARLTIHGRNPNRKQFYPEKNRTVVSNGMKYTRKSVYQQDLPRKYATNLAVYFNRPGTGPGGWGPFNNPKVGKIVKATLHKYRSLGANILHLP